MVWCFCNCFTGGNILVRKTSMEEVTFCLNGRESNVTTCGVKVHIIDFTIARITGENGEPVYLDLANDEEQFNGILSN